MSDAKQPTTSANQYQSPAAETISMKKWNAADGGEATDGGFSDFAPMDQPNNYTGPRQYPAAKPSGRQK